MLYTCTWQSHLKRMKYCKRDSSLIIVNIRVGLVYLIACSTSFSKKTLYMLFKQVFEVALISPQDLCLWNFKFLFSASLLVMSSLSLSCVMCVDTALGKSD